MAQFFLLFEEWEVADHAAARAEWHTWARVYKTRLLDGVSFPARRYYEDAAANLTDAWVVRLSAQPFRAPLVGYDPDSLGGAYVVNNFETGEWLAYSINVPAAGAYSVSDVNPGSRQVSAMRPSSDCDSCSTVAWGERILAGLWGNEDLTVPRSEREARHRFRRQRIHRVLLPFDEERCDSRPALPERCSFDRHNQALHPPLQRPSVAFVSGFQVTH